MVRVRNRRGERGFTLIEVAIGMVILGLFVAVYLQMYNAYVIGERVDTTTSNIQTIKFALQKYAVRNGRYPMPADPTLAPGDANYGREKVAATFVNCGTPPCRTSSGARNAHTGDAFNPDRVLIGSVPFATLGLPKIFILDGYGDQFTYAVTENLTNTANFADNRGAITVLNSAGAATPGTTGNPGNVHFVVFSHGADRKGARTISGAMAVACGGAAGADNENCDADARFTDNMFDYDASASTDWGRYEVTSAGGGHYDDYLGFSTTTTGDIWTRTANTDDIFNRNTLNIRVGAAVCADSADTPNSAGFRSCPNVPDARVDVAGDIIADRLEVTRLCTFRFDDANPCQPTHQAAGFETVENNPGRRTSVAGWSAAMTNNANQKTDVPRFFSPSIITGEPTPPPTNRAVAREEFYQNGGGINCGEKALTGIKEADELCNNAFVNTGYLGGVTCGVGRGGRRISGGTLQCDLP